MKDNDLVSFQVVVKETDLYISAAADLSKKANKLVVKYRDQLEAYIERCPTFLTTLTPMPIDTKAPAIAREMLASSAKVRVGPMAAVAGAIAEFVGRDLLATTPEIIVENGGDIYLKSLKKRLIGIYAGKSSLSGKLSIEIEGNDTPLGICTSSGTVGHSLSYGRADAVVVVSKSATLADASATAIGNMIVVPADINKGIDFAQAVTGLMGLIIIKDDTIGLWGDVKVH